MTDPLGQSQVLPYLVGLSKKSYRFSLISVEKPEKFEQNKAIIQKICDDNGIDWQPLIYTKNPPIFSTLFDIYRMFKKTNSLHKEKKFALLHCRSYIPALIGLSLKNKLKIKFVFDMRGFWADERIDGGLWNLNNFLYKRIYNYFKQKEKQFLENADGIVSLTQTGKLEMESWKNIQRSPLPISVIPCCVDIAHFNPSKITIGEQQNLRKTLGIAENDFVLSYLGSIGTWYLLEEMLQFFKILHSQNNNAKFLFITGDDPSKIINASLLLQIPPQNIIIKQANRNEVPLYISLSTYSIFFIKPSFSKKASSPTKQGEIMAMGIPLVCNNGVGDTDNIVEKYKAGLVVKAFTNNEYHSTIDSMFTNQKLFSPIALRAGAEDFFSLEKGIAKYLNVYKNCLRPNNPL
jgi:glycosyltransferase involved in cell wall biosynthesis